MSNHELFLRLAITLAKEARESGEDPFGAVLVAGDTMVHIGKDACISKTDPTAHAELTVISEYCRREKRLSLDECTLYCSAEPCVLCSGAIKWARISRVVFSVSQAMLQNISGGQPKPACASLINTGAKKAEIIGPLLPDEGLLVFSGFSFVAKRRRIIPS
jgi:tRNA(Arg) A34 adenosine deaminase TadA